MIHKTKPYTLKDLTCLAILLLFGISNVAWSQVQLENRLLEAHFNERGISEIYDKQLGKSVRLTGDTFRIRLDKKEIDGKSARYRKRSAGENTVTYHFTSGKYAIDVVYELRPDWRFVSKQLILSKTRDSYRVEEIEPFRGTIENAVSDEYLHYGGRYGVFLRMADKITREPTYGVFLALQNPFLKWERDGSDLSVKYAPEMNWHREYGAFTSDRTLIGTYQLSGQTYPVNMVPEWEYVRNPDRIALKRSRIDYAEIEALTRCVEAFLLYDPEESLRVHVGWTENDFQINTATPGGRTEYKRIIDQAAAVGAEHILYTPDHTGLTDLAENRDAWGWENLLWLNLGQKIRKGEWHPVRDPLPTDLQEMVDYAASKDIGLLAYVFPTMPWMQNREWTSWVDGRPGGYAGADTGLRSFQDWFLDLLIDFYENTGISGYSFDHWWVRYDQPGTTSMYAQWFGTRRILEELRRRAPGIVIDGRQQYHQLGPWTWLAGSYPHPMASDEQPQSFEAFPDLSWSRVSANRTRFANWWFRMNQFTPVQVMPGYMSHQTQRFNAEGKLFRTRFRPRDWDYMGWKYSVLSSIGTAPLNHVINYLPARDKNEFKHFSEEDKRWFNRWFDWTDEHIEYMREVRPIIGQPMVGRVDGSSAIIGDRGFVFLFNPNYRAMKGEFTLDKSIGLESGKRFVMRVLHPGEEGLIGHPDGGIWRYGDEVRIEMEGTQAKVLEIVPADDIKKPLLLNAAGKIELEKQKLMARKVRGPIGHQRQLSVLLPADTEIAEFFVNGSSVPFLSEGNRITTVVRFAGTRFDHAHQVGTYDSTFTGGRFTAAFRIPQRIFDQLERRREKWPIPYTEDDLKASWLGPHRLLLFVQIADPRQDMEVSVSINGESVELKKAYSSVYPQKNVTRRTFLGFYTDLSSAIKPGVDYKVTLELPVMEPGRFQGLFFHNIETEYTEKMDSNSQSSSD